MKIIKFKKGLDRDQELLMPRKIENYLEDNHLVKLICAICVNLDLSKIEAKYKVNGQNGYDPHMMVSLLFYGYSIGVRSSRKISKGCEERIDFMYITQGLTPSHDRISDFRKDNLEELKEIFKEIVLIGATLGLVNIGNIKCSIDGSKVKANASAKLTKDEEGLKKLLDKTQKEIDELFKEVKEIDEIEDKKYGKKKRGDELPKKLQSKMSRETAIKKALKTLQERKKEARTKLEKKTMKEKERKPTEKELEKIEKMKINTTDNDAKFMKERNGVIKPNYNCQISVEEKNQFIVANDVTTECNDKHQLVPMTEKTKENIGQPKNIKADNGYHSQAQLEKIVEQFPKTDFYVDDKKKREKDLDMKKVKKEYSEVEYKNLKKLLTKKGKREYGKRMHTAEPPFGNLKFNLGFRHFLLRGIKKVSGEFSLMCIAHDLKKIFSFLTRKGIGLASAISKIQKTTTIKLNFGYS